MGPNVGYNGQARTSPCVKDAPLPFDFSIRFSSDVLNQSSTTAFCAMMGREIRKTRHKHRPAMNDLDFIFRPPVFNLSRLENNDFAFCKSSKL